MFTLSYFIYFSVGIPICWSSFLRHWSRTQGLVSDTLRLCLCVWFRYMEACDRGSLCYADLVSGKDLSSRGQEVTASRAWTASAIISSVSAGHAAGWWSKTPSSCTWTETTAKSTLCSSSTRSSKWKWAVLSRTPNTESASRISPGRSALCVCRENCTREGHAEFVMNAWFVLEQDTDHQVQQLQTNTLVESWNKPAGTNLWLPQSAAIWRLRSSSREDTHEVVSDVVHLIRTMTTINFSVSRHLVFFYFILKVCEWTWLLWRPGRCSGTSQGGNFHHRLVVSARKIWICSSTEQFL